MLQASRPNDSRESFTSVYDLTRPLLPSPTAETLTHDPHTPLLSHRSMIPTSGTSQVTQSMVVDAATGQTKLDKIRTSYGGAFG